MAFFNFFKKSKLTKAIKLSSRARRREGVEADQLFDAAFKNFEEVIANDLLFSETLYNWGFALLHKAKMKTGDEAIALYEDAISKFAFCSTVNQSALGAAIDGGVAYMELARIKDVNSDDLLYDKAKIYFDRANKIQSGSASYNLACLYTLRNQEEACLEALEDSREHGSLPNKEDIENDPDLENFRNHRWFSDFMVSMDTQEDKEGEELQTTTSKLDADSKSEENDEDK